MAKELFRPLYSPPGYKYKDAKAAGLLRESETYWIRLRHQGRTIRESTKTDKYDMARQFLSDKKASLAKGEPQVRHATHVTFATMGEKLKRDYDLNGKHRPTLDARLSNLSPVFDARRMADIRPDDIDAYVSKRKAAKATNGTINRELEVLARAFSLGRKLGLLTATLRVRDHRLGESAPRQGFFERDQFSAVLQHLTRRESQEVDGKRKRVTVPASDLQLACTIGQTYGWRMQSEILMLERRQINLDAAGGMGTLSLDAGSTKNEDARVVVLTPQVKSLVEGQLGRVEAFQKRTGTITPYLFVHTQGEHQGARIKDFKRAWVTACRLAGVPTMLRHDFRRTAVRGMVNAGVPERVAMEISGHRTRSIFDRYHIVSQADHQRAAKLMADAATATAARSDLAKNVAK